jgi:glucokinase
MCFNAAALGEYRFGAGKGKKNVVYITVSTGIGGGAVIDGRLMRGSNGNAAELGHIPLTMDGPRCGCGNPGCWEVYASGTAIARRTREALRAPVLSSSPAASTKKSPMPVQK